MEVRHTLNPILETNKSFRACSQSFSNCVTIISAINLVSSQFMCPVLILPHEAPTRRSRAPTTPPPRTTQATVVTLEKTIKKRKNNKKIQKHLQTNHKINAGTTFWSQSHQKVELTKKHDFFKMTFWMEVQNVILKKSCFLSTQLFDEIAIKMLFLHLFCDFL